MNEKTNPKIKWLVFISLTFVISSLICCTYLWDTYFSESYKNEDAGALARLGYIPIEVMKSKAENITIERVDWLEYLENHDDYNIDFLIVGDSFSNVGQLPEYLATSNNVQVLALRVNEVEPFQKFSPINLLIALDNGGIIDMVDPDIILLEDVPRNIYQRTRSVDFLSNITVGEIKQAIITFNIQKDRNFIAENDDVVIKTNTRRNNTKDCTIDNFQSLDISDPFQIYFNETTTILINIRQSLMSLAWLQIYGHTYPIDGQENIVYRFYLDSPLFSSQKDQDVLYVISGDLDYLNHLDDKTWIFKYNLYLNALEDRFARKNITFFYMPAVDKYDYYYPKIKDNKYPSNPFFEDLEEQYKAYYFINTKDILKNLLKCNEKDAYGIGDTHWSWKSVQFLTKEISPLEPLEPRFFSIKENIDLLPKDPKILRAYADALVIIGEYEYIPELQKKVFEIETTNNLSSVILKESKPKTTQNRIYGGVQKIIPHKEYLEISGWAIDPVKEKPAKFVVITDDHRNIISVPEINEKRPSISSQFNNEGLLVSGWTTQIENRTFMSESASFNFYVIESETNIAYPINISKERKDLFND